MPGADAHSKAADVLLVLSCVPDQASADLIAGQLVREHLAACVNMMPGIRSVYEWRGKVEQAAEVLLLIKTTAPRFEALAAALRAAHPYELPEIVAVRLDRGLEDYLQWVRSATEP